MIGAYDTPETTPEQYTPDGGYQAAAVWEAPFVFVVTHADAATAMGVAEAVGDELEQIVADNP